MSWSQWPTATQPSVPTVLNPTATVINSAPAVVPPGLQYTPEQWAQLQQQNWHQWAQWQQQYQQWHQQYGAEYQKSMNALAAQAQQAVPTVPSLPNMAVPPPLPVEVKPPLPEEPPPVLGYQTAPPPPPQQSVAPKAVIGDRRPPVMYQKPPNWQQANYQTKRGYEQPETTNKRQMVTKPNWGPVQNKDSLEELSEAEKKFDKQFADWEAQFNKWKEQNAEHPDKEQYREYEKKWESWRAQLLERREQMKRKRLGLLDTPTRVRNQFNQSNQSFNSPQQQNFTHPPPSFQPKPDNVHSTPSSGLLGMSKPPPNLNDEPLAFKNRTESLVEENVSDFIKPNMGGGIPGLDLVKDDPKPHKDEDVVLVDSENRERKGPDFDAISKGINNILGDQKLLNMLNLVSQTQQLPKFSDNPINTTSRIHDQDSNQFYDQSNQSVETHSNHSEKNFGQREFVNNFDDQTRSSFTMHHEQEIRIESDVFNKNQNQFGPRRNKFGLFEDKFGPGVEGNRFGPGLRGPEGPRDRFGLESGDRFPPDDRNRFNFKGNRFGPVSERDRFGPDPERDRFGPNSGPGQSRFNLRENRFGQNQDRFSSGDNYENEQRRFGPHFETQGNSSFDNYNQNDYDDYHQNYDENYEEYDYDNAASNFDVKKPPHQKPWVEETYQEEPEKVPEKEVPLPQSEDIFQAVTVIDYDHKTLKQTEPEVLIEPIYMFDYRHKPLNRIPLPQRPKWLTETVKNIREFDPPVVRPYETANLRRYPPPSDNWRNDRFQDGRHFNRRGYEERRPYEDSRPKNDWKKPYEDRNLEKMKAPPPAIDYEEEKISDTEWPDDDFEEVKPEVVNFQKPVENKRNAVLIEDLINPPGRYKRPPRIVIILRGPPGSGKTFLAKLIKDREVENGGSAPRILSLDDYFMVEQEKEVVEDGKKVKVKDMVYEYEEEMEESYRISLIKSFKKTITDGYFSFIIVDNVNDKVKYFGEMWSFAKQNGFQVYICQLDLDVQTCSKRNIHGRSEADIEKCVANWETTPSHHPVLDATSLLQSSAIREVEMEEVNSPESDINDNEGSEDQVARSKWDNFDCSVDNLAKLDGLSKPLRHKTMEEYLQLDSDWAPTKPTKPGQKRVRWADLEEQKQQEKMRAIGFVVGQTNWDRMMDPTGGSSALTQTKYIERTGRFKVDQRRND